MIRVRADSIAVANLRKIDHVVHARPICSRDLIASLPPIPDWKDANRCERCSARSVVTRRSSPRI